MRNNGVGKMLLSGYVYWRDWAWMDDMIRLGKFDSRADALRQAMIALAEKKASEDSVARAIYQEYDALCANTLPPDDDDGSPDYF
ncbi:hypothetical protein H0K60_004493 [Salmonella enterica]|nr:hypothetical protein [Salmonella enterica]EFR2649735.1 hypothetical protein [Salmonella enterica]EFS1408084.1 hypothetical protein [Salmonella enterica]EHQ8162532.1 hypothetical protein [Salmonella enterica]EJZ9218185.1 hypothetical protein [Salmonella enterica]